VETWSQWKKKKRWATSEVAEWGNFKRGVAQEGGLGEGGGGSDSSFWNMWKRGRGGKKETVLVKEYSDRKTRG